MSMFGAYASGCLHYPHWHAETIWCGMDQCVLKCVPSSKVLAMRCALVWAWAYEGKALSNYHNQHGYSYSPKKSGIQSYMKGDLKKHSIFLILTLVFTSIAKKVYNSELPRSYELFCSVLFLSMWHRAARMDLALGC